MRCCTTRQNAAHKYSNPFASHRQELKLRQIERKRQRCCLHGMPSFLPSCLWGIERVAPSTREQLVVCGHIRTLTASDFFSVFLLLFVPKAVQDMSAGWPQSHDQRKRGTSFVGICRRRTARAGESMRRGGNKQLVYSAHECLFLSAVAWEDVCQNHVGYKIEMQLHH